MDEWDLRKRIADAQRDAKIEIDGLYEELETARRNLVEATQINAVLVALFGSQINDEWWQLKLERRRLESFPWENVSLRVEHQTDTVVLDLKRKDDAKGHVSNVDPIKRGL